MMALDRKRFCDSDTYYLKRCSREISCCGRTTCLNHVAEGVSIGSAMYITHMFVACLLTRAMRLLKKAERLTRIAESRLWW